MWGITAGPIAVEDIDESYEGPEGSTHYMGCTGDIDGKIGDDNFWFEDFNDAYEWVKYFSKTAEPLLLDMGSDPESNQEFPL